MYILPLFLFSSTFLPAQLTRAELQKQPVIATGESRVNLLNQLADSSLKTSINNSADFAGQALKLARKINYRFGEAVALRTIGITEYRKNELDNAGVHFSKSLAIFLELKDSILLCELYNDFGLLNWKKEEFVSAYQHFRNALKLAKSKKLKKQEAQSFNYIGLIYWKWSEYSSALDYFFQSLEIKESLKDDFETGITLNNIANIYNEFNRPDEAIIYAERCMKFANNLPNKYVLGRALNNLGVSYFKKKDFIKAIEYQNKSLAIKTEKGDVLGEAFSFADLGEVYFAQKDFNKAYQYFHNALSIWKDLHDSYGIAKTNLNLGKVYAAQGFWAEAESFINSSLTEAKKNNNKKIIAEAYLSLSAFFESQKNYESALRMHKLYSMINDSLLNTATSDKLAELRVIKEMDEKEKEVELLTQEKKIQTLEIEEKVSQNKILFFGALAGVCLMALLVIRFIKIRKLKILLEEKNKDISLKSKELEEANAAKDKFFSIIAHDLKSPFTGLLGYSEILADEFDSMSREERLKTVGFLKNLITRVYTLIENLLDWSRIQTGRIELNPIVINLKTDVPEILTLLKPNAEAKQITLTNNIEIPLFVFTDNYSFRSIMQNVVSNAVKFTNQNGVIFISARETEEMVTINIRDNGIGIDPDLLSKIFNIETRHTTRGTADETGTGLGLLLCKELAEINGGTIVIKSSVGVGTTISISLPKAKDAQLNPPQKGN